MPDQRIVLVRRAIEPGYGRWVFPSGYVDRGEQIHAAAILEAKEEFILAKNWTEKEDVDAAHKMVTSHLRLVAKIAMGYRGYGLPLGELISEGNVGLMQAVKRFQPDRGFRLATYAMWWIKASIQEYILRSWSLVKIGTTTAQKKLFFNLKKVKNQIAPKSEGDLKDEHVTEIADKLSVSKDEVVSMNRRLSGKEFSLNAPIGEDGDEWQDWLCLLYTSPSPRDGLLSRMPSSA